MQAAAPAPGLCYAEATYPYFFKDTERRQELQRHRGRLRRTASRPGRRRSLKAAHNYQLWRKDPGAWAHNFDYTAQLLYDSAADLGADVSKLRRP